MHQGSREEGSTSLQECNEEVSIKKDDFLVELGVFKLFKNYRKRSPKCNRNPIKSRLTRLTVLFNPWERVTFCWKTQISSIACYDELLSLPPDSTYFWDGQPFKFPKLYRLWEFLRQIFKETEKALRSVWPTRAEEWALVFDSKRARKFYWTC